MGIAAGVDDEHARGDVAGGPVDAVPAMPLRAIRTTHVETWVKSMTRRPPSGRRWRPGTIKTRFVNVRSVFRAAVRDRSSAPTPPTVSGFPGSASAPRRSDPVPDEVGRCLAVSEERFRAFIAVCALAGLRLGEAAALQFGDVDYTRRLLQVRRQVQRAGGKTVEIRLPKYGSERAVPMPEELAAILRGTRISGTSTEWMFAGGEPTRRTRTRSVPGGAPPSGGPGSPGSGCTTCGTSTPPG